MMWYVGWFYGAFPVGILAWFAATACGATKPAAVAVAGVVILIFAIVVLGLPHWTGRRRRPDRIGSDRPH